jgi:isochorismate hydrolase
MEINDLALANINLKSISTQAKYLTDSTDISPADCLFIMVDLQERFKDIIHNMEEVIKNSDILNRAAELLEIPLLITEQSPEKLGKTLPELHFPEHAKLIEKTSFSVFDETISSYIESTQKPVLVIYGIEAHVCITQSCLDAIKRAYHVLLVYDAISSRAQQSKKIAVKMLSHKGVEIVTTEMLLFRLLKDAKHPKFRDISKLVK